MIGDLSEDPAKLKMLRVSELNKHHRLDKNLKITRHWLLQMNHEGADLLQTRLTERDKAENEPLLDSDKDDNDEEDNGGSESSIDEENENDYIDSSDRDESSDHSCVHR